MWRLVCEAGRSQAEPREMTLDCRAKVGDCVRPCPQQRPFAHQCPAYPEKVWIDWHAGHVTLIGRTSGMPKAAPQVGQRIP